MSRAIKFRVWMEADKRMVPWEQAWNMVCKVDSSIVGGQEGVEFSLLTIALLGSGKGPLVAEQWTGLVDRNGVEVYEGDIITRESIPCDDSHGNKVTPTPFVKPSVVKWDPTGWCHYFATRPDGPSPWLNSNDSDYLTVVGNIHQHPQLLTSDTPLL